MSPIAHRGGTAADTVQAAPDDAPTLAIPPTLEAPRTAAPEDADGRYRGELFLPGWLRIEREPSAEQGPGA